MEKIKSALERANATRCTAHQKIGINNRAKPGQVTDFSSIKYKHTRKIELQQDYLLNNRILIDDNNIASDAYKVLRTKVLQSMRNNSWNSLAITSPSSGDGKTITAINLAISLSKEVNQTVLLVDFDLRKPRIGKYFTSQELPGISDLVEKKCVISEVLFNPCIERLVVLPGNKPILNSSEMLSSPTILSIVNELKNYYSRRIVVFDLPPILLCDDMLAFSPYVDSTILIAEDGKNKEDELIRACQMMDQDKFIGLVLNKSREKVTAYTY